MSSVNKIMLLGRVGNAPDIKYTQKGDKIATFSMCTFEQYKDKSGQKKKLDQWHKVVVFNSNIANFIENYVQKGSLVYVEGQLTSNKWEDADGKSHITWQVSITNFKGDVKLMDSRGEKTEPTGTFSVSHAPEQKPMPFVNTIEDDSIPF